MKVNSVRDIMKYITKYITRDIVIVTAILLFVSIVFLVFTRKVIENADNADNADNVVNNETNQSSNKNPNPDPKLDTPLNQAAKKHMANATYIGNSLMTGLNSHLNNKL